MKKITLLLITVLVFSQTNVFSQLVVKPTFFETQGVSNEGLVSGYESQAGPYSLWSPEDNTFEQIGGAAPGLGVGGAAKFSADGNFLSGTSYITETTPTSWVKMNTGFNYIFRDIEFPDYQSSTAFAAGQSLTSNGDGIVIVTYDGGDTWQELWTGANQGIEAMSFPSQYTGYVGGWNQYFAKSSDGGYTWTPQTPGNDVYIYTAIKFKDEYYGVVGAQTNDGVAIYSTFDGGETWMTGSGLSGVPYKITHVEGDTYFLVTNGGDIQRSDDNGLTWNTVFSSGGLLLGIDFYDAMTGIATAENDIYKTTDGGVTWVGQQVIEGALWRDVAWLDADNVTLIGTPELIFESEDGGATWPNNNLNTTTLNEALYEALYTENGTGYIIGSQGVLFRKLPATNTFSIMSLYNLADSQWSTLGSFDFPVDGSLSSGYSISGDGTTVVGSAWVEPTPGEFGLATNAAVWTAENGLVDLGSLYQNINRASRANAVSYDGSVIVGWQDLNGPWKAAVWRKDENGNYPANEYLLIDPNGDPSDEYNQLGEALVVSGDGHWIGGIGDYANNNEPWLWNDTTGYISLGTLNENFTGFVNGINHDGTMAMGFFQGGPWDNNIPFIWTAADGIQDLNDYIINTLGYEMGASPIWAPNAMSPNGQFIVGWGYDPTIGPWGDLFTFRLELPETLSVAEQTPNTVSLYPNPVTDVLNVNAKIDIDSIDIYNLNGQLLISKKIGALSAEIDLSTFSNGLYFATIMTANNQTETFKVIKD